MFRREVPKKTRMTAPEVKLNTDELDLKKCAAHFETCGWDSLEFDPRFSSLHSGLSFPHALACPFKLPCHLPLKFAFVEPALGHAFTNGTLNMHMRCSCEVPDKTVNAFMWMMQSGG